MTRLIQRKLYLVNRIVFAISLLLLHSCKEKKEPIIEENVLDLEEIHIDSILSKYTVLEHTKQFRFKAYEFISPSFDYYHVITNPFLYKNENKEYTSAPGLKYPYPSKTICYAPYMTWRRMRNYV